MSYISALRFPLAFLVVLIHVYSSGWQASASPALNQWATWLFKDFTAFAVPLFFVISGFLFFYRKPSPTLADYGEKYQRRIFTLLVPYIAWNLIAFVLYALKDLAGGMPIQHSLSLHLFWDAQTNGAAHLNPWGWNIQASTAPVLLPLWFVRNLIVTVLLAPLLHPILRLRWGLGLALLGLIHYAELWPNYGGITSGCVWYFGLGAWCSIQGKDLAALTRPLGPVCTVLTPAFLVGLCLFPALGGLFLPLYILSAMVFSLQVAHRATLHRQPLAFLSQSSFFLYASHTIFLLPLSTFLAPRTADLSLPLQLLVLFASALLATFVSLFLFYLLRRFLPRASRVLTGVRA